MGGAGGWGGGGRGDRGVLTLSEGWLTLAKRNTDKRVRPPDVMDAQVVMEESYFSIPCDSLIFDLQFRAECNQMYCYCT